MFLNEIMEFFGKKESTEDEAKKTTCTGRALGDLGDRARGVFTPSSRRGELRPYRWGVPVNACDGFTYADDLFIHDLFIHDLFLYWSIHDLFIVCSWSLKRFCYFLLIYSLLGSFSSLPFQNALQLDNLGFNLWSRVGRSVEDLRNFWTARVLNGPVTMSVCHKSWCLKTRHSPAIPSKFWVCPRYWENTNMMSCTPTQLSGMQLSHRWELFLIENRLFLRASNQILIHLNPRSELWVRDTSREHVQNTSTKTKTKNSLAHRQGYRVLQGYNPSNIGNGWVTL